MYLASDDFIQIPEVIRADDKGYNLLAIREEYRNIPAWILLLLFRCTPTNAYADN